MIHEGQRRGTKKTFARSHIGLYTKGGGEHLFVHEGPRRATKGHEGPRRATKGHEGARRKPLQGHILVCTRRAGENTFLSTKGHEGPRRKPLQGHDWAVIFVHEGPRNTTKDHEENLCKNIIWAVREGRWKTPFCPRRGTKKIFCGGRGSWSSTKRIRQETVRFCPRATCFSHCVSSLVQVSREPGKHQWIGDSG